VNEAPPAARGDAAFTDADSPFESRSAALAALRHAIELLLELTRKEIRLRYKSSYLGYLWSVLNPLALAAVYYLAFSVIMKVKIENYAFVLVVGLFPWQWFTNSVQASASTYLMNAVLLKKVRFPRSLLPLSTVLNDLLHFGVTVPVTIILGWQLGSAPAPALLVGLPLIVLAQLGVTFGFSLAIAAVNPFFRDIERLVSVIVMILFFCTPIVYTADMIPAAYRPFFDLNPMFEIVVAYRELFVQGKIAWGALAVSYGWAAIALLAGGLIHRQLEWRLAEVL
jgi:lipopolysaccharide transport system permease protein